MSRPMYIITVVPIPGWPTPAIIRLRRFLKAALRSWGLRCTECREHDDGPPLVLCGQEQNDDFAKK